MIGQCPQEACFPFVAQGYFLGNGASGGGSLHAFDRHVTLVDKSEKRVPHPDIISRERRVSTLVGDSKE